MRAELRHVLGPRIGFMDTARACPWLAVPFLGVSWEEKAKESVLFQGSFCGKHRNTHIFPFGSPVTPDGRTSKPGPRLVHKLLRG